MNYIKLTLRDILAIKQNQHEKLAAIHFSKNANLNSLQHLNVYYELSRFMRFITDDNQCNYINDLWSSICKPLFDFGSGKPYNMFLLIKNIESLVYVIELTKSVLKYQNQIENVVDAKEKKNLINRFIWFLSVAFKFAQELYCQQKHDINMEMVRGVRLLCLYEINSNSEFKTIAANLKSTFEKLYS